jgi:hypothetical protein
LGLLAPGERNVYRKIGNDLTHTYPEKSEDLVDAINQAAAMIGQLETSFIKMRSFCQDKLGLFAA